VRRRSNGARFGFAISIATKSTAASGGIAAVRSKRCRSRAMRRASASAISASTSLMRRAQRSSQMLGARISATTDSV
jgi:hypothetical protein